MQVGIIGINCGSSLLQLREILTRVFQKEFGHVLDNTVLLSTCNRAELYFSSPCLARTHTAILASLRRHLKAGFEHALYSYFGPDCFYHLGRVISGVDSAIFGESEIQRQVKLAYEQARQVKMLSHDLHYLFQKGLKIGKEIRTHVLAGKGEWQLPRTIHSVLEWMGAKIREERVLFIGNSMINRRLIAFFQQKRWEHLTLCTRMQEGEFPAIARVNWQALKRWTNYQVIICATCHDQYILTPKQCDKKIILFDLSVPRNIHPDLGRHPSFHLYNLDELGGMIQKRGGSREKEKRLCETFLQEAVRRQMVLFKKRREAKWRHGVSSSASFSAPILNRGSVALTSQSVSLYPSRFNLQKDRH